jgi:probable F420-dependent oxidoreductase
MGLSAGLGIANLPFNDSREFWRWVDLCEAGGVDSLWQSDRIIGPEPNLDCMSAMAALAGRTRRMKFGMNVASLGLRDPVIMAKTCASIDFLSAGRLLPAFGIGSARSRDYVATGTPTAGRGVRASEGLEIMTRLWQEEAVTFSGRFYQLEDAVIAPKPVQNPLPLWIGGSSAQAVARTARFGTGWQAGIESPAEVGPVVAAIKAELQRTGRHIAEDHYGAGFAFRFGSMQDPVCSQYARFLQQRLGKDPDGFMAVGGTAEMLELIAAFRAAGIHKFILRPMATDAADMLEQTRRFIEQLLPELPRS